MYELINTIGNSYYIEAPSKIGLVKLNDSDVVLIDSGNHKDTAKKIKKILDANSFNLKAIYNTHSHADHIGGNKYLFDQYGCDIYAPGIECDFTNHTILEPSLVYGAYPPKDLKHKFLLAQESPAKPLTKETLPNSMEIIDLKGHVFDMVGFKTSDDVIYLADCLSSEETLNKYGIGYIYDIENYLLTLEKVKTLEAALFIPSHAAPTENIAPLAQINIDKVNEICETILIFLKDALNFETLLQKLFSKYNMTMTFEQYALVGSTVRSYLSYLKDKGEIETEIKDNMLLWKTK